MFPVGTEMKRRDEEEEHGGGRRESLIRGQTEMKRRMRKRSTEVGGGSH